MNFDNWKYVIYHFLECDNDTDKWYNIRINKQRGEIMNFITKEEFINESNIEIIQKLKDNDLIKLSKYADVFGIKEKIMVILLLLL